MNPYLSAACALLATAAIVGAGGCTASSPPPRQPIDGLRMAGFEEPLPAAPAGQQAGLKRMDFRFEGDEG